MVEALLVILIVLVIGLLVVVLTRKSAEGQDQSLTFPIDKVSQMVAQFRSETVGMVNTLAQDVRQGRTEMMGTINALNGTMQNGKTDTLNLINNLRGELHQARTETSVLSTRMSSLDQKVEQANQSLTLARTDLTKTGTNTLGLIGAAQMLGKELADARESIATLHTQAQARQEMEHRSAESIRRLELVIAGTATRGMAGENILENVFSQLPTDWQVRDVQVNGKTCEFGLRLPNQLVLPIDSKWTATNLLEEFFASVDLPDQLRIKSEIEKKVLSKALEVKKYIEPSLTVNFAVAVVPDAVFELCSQCICEAFRQDVVIVSYSMFIPYLLLVFQTILKTSQSLDMEKLDRELRFAEKIVDSLQKEVDNRFARAITMLSNSRDDMSKGLGKLRGGLVSLQMSDAALPDAAKDDEPMALPDSLPFIQADQRINV